ncbi:MAG: hypothetical protein Q8P18_28895 [Pseudomonadota bacterium]|nr:hypothetical protein [Pseudomonadota bacterium]
MTLPGALLLPLLSALVAPAHAAPVELHTSHQLGVALFPEGVQYVFEAEARLPLWKSDHFLLADGHIALAGHAEITPSFPRVGPVLRIAPVAFWDATFRAYGTWYIGAFSSILPFDDPAFEATKANKRELVADGVRTGGWGLRLDAETRLKGRAGPVIVVLELQWRHHHVEAYDRDLEWFWDPSEMLNVSADGDVINRNGYLFFELIKPVKPAEGVPANDRKLWIGALGMWQSSPQSGDRNIRLGPVLFWKPANGPTVPTMIVGSQVWLDSNFTPVFPPYTFVAANWAR